MRGWRFAAAIATALLVVACGGPTEEEEAASDARDIAAVEAANRQVPPARKLALAPILFPDIRKMGLYGPGCAFVPDGGGMGAVLMTEQKRAVIKPGKDMVVLASDPGSAPAPEGTWSHYVGKAHSLTLTPANADGGSAQWRGRLVITDPHDQEVYRAEGLVQCKG